jgi:UDP-N-acetylmuramate--alanine ligase
MSALARYFKGKGIIVSGYDKTPTTLTDHLITEGMVVHFEDDIDKIPANIDLIIYTPAIPKDLNEFIHLAGSGIPMKKRSEILGELTRDKKTIAVAGTHGKTTVSALIAHLMKQAGLKCTSFLGGISKNYKTNLLTTENSDWMVVEADEYDKSFLQLHPDIGIITSTDADHLDIYGNIETLKSTFQQYAANIKRDGILLIKKRVELNLDELKCRKIFYYSRDEKTDYGSGNIRFKNDRYVFDFVTPENTLHNIVSGIPGMVNVENAIAALTAARMAGVKDEDLIKGLLSFSGMERRFDVQVKSENLIYIDDYAHHPKEIKATVSSIKQMYPGKKIIGIFQPHLFTRTRDFADEFAKSLELLDEVILLPVYPAREKPIDGVNSEMILNRISKKEKEICSKESLLNTLAEKKFEILLTLGAGDIDQLVNPIKNYLIKTRIK